MLVLLPKTTNGMVTQLQHNKHIINLTFTINFIGCLVYITYTIRAGITKNALDYILQNQRFYDTI